MQTGRVYSLAAGLAFLLASAPPAGNVTVPTCGDGIIQTEAGEECDNCEDGPPDNGPEANCTDECKCNRCGDGTVDTTSADDTPSCPNNAATEECDDGNSVSGDGCSAQCLVEGECPATVVVANCDSGVPALLPDGTCAQDLVGACATLIQTCPGRRAFKTCISGLGDLLGSGFGAVRSCAFQDKVKPPTCLKVTLSLATGPRLGGESGCVAASAACRASNEQEKSDAKKAWQATCEERICKKKECDAEGQPRDAACTRKTDLGDVKTVDVSVRKDNFCPTQRPKGCYVEAVGVCQCQC